MGEAFNPDAVSALADQAAPRPAAVQVFLLGSFRLIVHGRSVSDRDWRRRKARQLFKCLLSRPQRRLLKDEGMELFWPESDPDAASTNLRTAVYALRQALRPAGDQLIIEDRASYAVGPDPAIWVDADAFLMSVEQARTADDPVPLLEYADSLYTGDFLSDDLYEDWAADRRNQLKRTWTELQLTLARLGREREEPQRAVAALERMLQADACDESAAQELMRLLSQQGHRSAALRVYQRLVTALREDLGVEPSGVTAALHRHIAIATRTQAASNEVGSNTSSALANLPVQPTRLIGRSRELTTVTARLVDPQVRLLTLTGPGGVGKSRLAVAAAADKQTAFRHGARFVDLSPVRDPTLVMLSIARALGIPPSGSDTTIEQVRAYLRQRQMLLVLDNCEQVLDAAPEVADLLTACPDVKVLSTSREPLRLRWEHVVEVRPLDVPDLDCLPDLEQLAQTPAVALLLERAGVVGSALALTEQNAAKIAEVCARLDGLPLALELAAARLRALSPELLLAHLDHRPEILQGARDAPDRHQSLSAAIAWSYDLLSESERRVFERLAVFAGGCSMEVAVVVCGGDGVASGDVLDRLGQLVDKSLVLAEPLGSAWYRLLETIRQYAGERLIDRGDLESTQRKQAEWYVTLVDEANDGVRGPEQAAWLERLDREHNNFRTVLSWTIEREEADLALRLGAGLWRFWAYRGYWNEGRRWLERVLDLPGPVNRARLISLMGAGRLAAEQGDFVAARTYHELQLAQAAAPDVWVQRAAALTQLGNLAQRAGDLTTARLLLSQGLAIWEEHDNGWGAANCRTGLAGIAFTEGDHPTFRRLVNEALAAKRTAQDELGVSSCLLLLAHDDVRGGELHSARARFRESLMTSHALKAPGHTAAALIGFARLGVAEGHYERAFRLLGAAAAQRTAHGGEFDWHKWDIESGTAAARRALGDAAALAAIATGTTLSLEQAIAYALEEAVPIAVEDE